MAESSSHQASVIQIDTDSSYFVKPRTMVLDKEDLIVQVESPADFIELKRQGVNIGSYLLYQELEGYF